MINIFKVMHPKITGIRMVRIRTILAAIIFCLGIGGIGGGIVLALSSESAMAQAATAMPPPSPMPVPNELELAKLIWSTMAAVDHANAAGNYSVLRDLSAPAFQMNNDSARLAKIFETLRASNVDLSNTMLLAPTYEFAPVIMSGGILHVKGFFGLRPTAIGFDLYYQWLQGKWRLYGVSIVPSSISAVQPGPPGPPARPPAQPTRPPAQPRSDGR